VFTYLDLMKNILSYILPYSWLDSCDILPSLLTFYVVFVFLLGGPRSTESSFTLSSKPSDFMVSLSMVQWADSMGCSFAQIGDNTGCSLAAERGLLPVLEWLRSQDPPCQWDPSTCALAARNGHLHVLQWLRSQRFPCEWNESTCEWAAQNGHLRVLQ
jgi:hypothetical protein